MGGRGRKRRRRLGVILPCRPLWEGISSPNLMEGTCREASRTCPGNTCVRFRGVGDKKIDRRRTEAGMKIPPGKDE